ncbi:MAG TPA: S8 family serine peptidase [Candidatus Mediterraneibacter faecavium]|uniref:S8 family serine peptidase n=1 Tax=Candidatus Mediterraneibacter faecavium TaxID=2838668 RepID=A0A9D2Q8W7_9FIRM|nr:S8 family serine peptidase [Candidatus Mediterraneibacter faecavium]
MNQKIENLLNLAFEATPEERERSGELDVGYDPEEREWELIVKYSGSLEPVRDIAVSVTELLNGYAVVVIREERIEELAGFPEVEFIEKPKSLYFQADVGRQVSCVDAVQTAPYDLSGRGVLIGIVDSGIDYENPDFRNEDGTTRIAYLWDQSVSGIPPSGYAAGSEFTREDINAALERNDPGSFADPDSTPDGTSDGASDGTPGGMLVGGAGETGTDPDRILSRDISGHGTAVAGIAAGNGRGSEGRRYRGAAPESELIIVKMKSPQPGCFPRTTELMTGVDYVIRKALELRMPVAVNISFGNTYGSHEPYN